jgi:hypothetical protein
MRIAKTILTIMLFISILFAQSKTSIASVGKDNMFIFSHNKGNLNWQHGDEDRFGYYNKWSIFTNQSSNRPSVSDD